MGSRKLVGIFLLGFVLHFTKLLAIDTDSAKFIYKPVKVPKHYFNKTIYLDFYAPNKRQLDTVNLVSRKLKSYQLSQLTMGFNLPLFTKDIYNKDSTLIKNFHFLLTGGFTSTRVDFAGIKPHTFTKTYIGFRGLYNNGKKSLFFVEVAPFITEDKGNSSTAKLRLSTTLLYNCSVTEAFAFRVGFTRSFLLGNLFNLPYIGIRVGKLNKVNFSLQFPRSITLNIPCGKYIRTSLYAQPQGGFYTFANTDSVRLGSIYENKTLFFGRSEFLLGTRVDILPTKHFSFYLSGGLTTRNKIEFFPTSKKSNVVYRYNNYYQEKIKGGIFINFGLVFRFGKTKSIYNNLQMYNAIDLNNGINSVDNVHPGNSQIPTGKEKMGNNKTDDVIDLIEAKDLY